LVYSERNYIVSLSRDQYIDRIYPEDLVKKPDAWCERYMVGTTEAALRKPRTRIKAALKRRVLGMPYRDHASHAYYVKLGQGVTVRNWMNALAAKRILQQVGYGSTPGESQKRLDA
jgi:hypothetical protein